MQLPSQVYTVYHAQKGERVDKETESESRLGRQNEDVWSFIPKGSMGRTDERYIYLHAFTIKSQAQMEVQ